MRLFVNERSLAEPNATARSVADQIADFLRARVRYPVLQRAVFCTKLLPQLELGDGQPLRASIDMMPPPVRTIFYNWVARQGPFLEDDRTVADDDLFFFEGTEVTDEGLGEAARRMLRAGSVGAYSFLAAPASRCGRTPLDVLHGFEDAPLGHIAVPNFWNAAAAAAAVADDLPEPASWPALLAACRERFSALTIGTHCEEVLARSPFEINVARRSAELLSVLQRLVEETAPDGRRSAAAEDLMTRHFHGDKAWFSDSSPDEKHRFLQDMTFPRPDGGAGRLTCFFHGKIKWPQYRIHFEWPIPPPYDRLQVAYIGPKLTKR